ncbi:MAG TPA: hypothetical protein VGE59_04410 [Patescibacteria group bacterium]
MITIAHVLVGGAVGVVTGNPLAALVAGTASHFAMDLIPHLDHPPYAPKDKKGDVIFSQAIYVQAFCDVIIAATIVCILWYSWFDFSTLHPFAWGAFGGFLPDLIDNVPFWNKPFRKSWFGSRFHRFHDAIHHVWTKTFPMHRYWLLGILTQVVAVVIAWNVLKNYV